MRKRIIDLQGCTIVEPKHFHKTKTAAYEMLDEMEKENIDISDMFVVLNNLMSDLQFYLMFHLTHKEKE